MSNRIIDTGGTNPYKYCFPAAVAELADAQASGACVLRDVEVRLLSAAEPRIGTGDKPLGPIFWFDNLADTHREGGGIGRRPRFRS